MEEPLHIELRNPCPKRWEELQGSGPRRHCASCELAVTHLSLLERAEAEAVLARGAQERVCIAFRTDARGRVLFADGRRRATRWTQAAAALLTLLFPFLPGCRRAATSPRPIAAGPESAPSESGERAAEESRESLGELEYMGY